METSIHCHNLLIAHAKSISPAALSIFVIQKATFSILATHFINTHFNKCSKQKREENATMINLI
jgi:membrane protein insertase Oxa1/YidC/SpoIIIJ